MENSLNGSSNDFGADNEEEDEDNPRDPRDPRGRGNALLRVIETDDIGQMVDRLSILEAKKECF